MKNTTSCGRILLISTILLAAAITFGFALSMDLPVYATTAAPSMTIGSENVLKNNANTDDAPTVWFAGNSWRVISYDRFGNKYTNSRGAMTLFASNNLVGSGPFNQTIPADAANDYQGSVLQNTVNHVYHDLFSAKEKRAVLNRTLSAKEYLSSNPYSTGVSKTITSGYLWPLSSAEAYSLPSNAFRQADYQWWLRSPGFTPFFAASVYRQGFVQDWGSIVDRNYGVRPAFNMNINAILFTTSAVDGKPDTTDSDPLQPIRRNPACEWKLTLRDDGMIPGLAEHADYDVSEIIETENGVSIVYTGATTGTNEYISAIITDKPISDPSAEITYYGRIKQCTSKNDTSGSITIDVSDKLCKNSRLYVFNEQWNGDRHTNYASALKEIKLLSLLDGQSNTVKKDTPGRGTAATTPADLRKDDSIFHRAGKKTSRLTAPGNDVHNILLTKMTPKGARTLALSWTRINNAEGYDIFLAKCRKKSTCRLVKTIKNNDILTWKKKSLTKRTAYKALVRAWIMKDGKKFYIKTSPTVYAYTSGSTKYHTNAKGVVINKTNVFLATGKTFTIKAKVIKLKKGKKLMPRRYVPELRYLSSDTNVATVNNSGQITTKGKGVCKIYTYSANGSSKILTVTVR